MELVYAGEVIRGWDEGVKTMLKGEQATLKCLPEYAYGEAGRPPTIPANSTLLFDVELLSWKSVKDITGDGGIIKTTSKEGSGWDNPKDKDEVLGEFNAVSLLICCLLKMPEVTFHLHFSEI